jgi:hypothetical protein
LGTKVENVILLASKPHKVTEGDIKALLHLLNFDKIQAWATTCILVQLAKHFYENDIFQHRSIQGFIQSLKQQWKRKTDDNHHHHGEFKSSYHCTIALKLVKYRTFAEQFAIDEDFMEIMTNIIIQDCDILNFDAFLLLLTLRQHKNVRNIFYQKYTKISMKNILKRISLKVIHNTKLVQLKIEWCLHIILNMLDLSLQSKDMLAKQIIDEGGDDIVLGIFDYFFTNESIHYTITKQLFSILEGFAIQKEGEAIIIKHVHLLLQSFIGVNKHDSHIHDG